MENGGFKLRKWASNSKVFRERVALDQLTSLEESKDLKVLENERYEGITRNDRLRTQQEQHIHDSAKDDQKTQIADSSTARVCPARQMAEPKTRTTKIP